MDLPARVVAVYALAALASTSEGTTVHRSGINIPPKRGSSGSGSMLPGTYDYVSDYSASDISHLPHHGFDSIRIPVNKETADSSIQLNRMKDYVDAIGGHALICMFDDNENDVHGDGHGDGLVNDLQELTTAWGKIHDVFSSYNEVFYEIFNEPFGYTTAAVYLDHMSQIISGAGLPTERTVLDGLSYASDLKGLVAEGYQGLLAYHFYPMWLPSGQRSEHNFSEFFQAELSGLASRTFVTEFGGALNVAGNPHYASADPETQFGNVNVLRGLHCAYKRLEARGEVIKGSYHWHGWHNDDSYDFWAAANVNGQTKVKNILADAKSGVFNLSGCEVIEVGFATWIPLPSFLSVVLVVFCATRGFLNSNELS